MDKPRESQFLLYTGPDGQVNVEVFLAGETVWLTQKRMAELFGVDRTVVLKHLKNIFEAQELQEKSNVQKLHIANSAKPVTFYNLDVIISVGYRINSWQATQFRIWATRTLRSYVIKGFALDSERLKNGQHFGKDYFEELLEKVREIRASERRFYQKITDIYAISADYDPKATITREFFAVVQNKLGWAITGKTGPELIYASADASKPNMGLATWKNAPRGKILKSDTTIAKNYLGQRHIKELERLVSAYLDLAENRAQRRIVMTMADWAKFLQEFLKLSDYPILKDKGKVSRLKAELKAAKEFEKFRAVQDRRFESDFDREVKRLERKQSDD